MALLSGDNAFIDNISESFGKFGIKTEGREKGDVKNALRLDMFDTIHNSKYIAVAVKSSVGKNAAYVWNDIIEKDLIPSAEASGSGPAAALIVPSKDADAVVEMCKKKYLTPTVYQLFPGYVVAGFQKKDVARLIEEYKKNKEKNEDEQPQEEKNTNPPQENGNEAVPEKPAQESIETKEKQHEKKQPVSKSNAEPPSPLSKKLAAAALLGITLGLMPLGAKTVMDKISKNNENTEEKKADGIAVAGYFDGIKNGIPQDNELLKYIASNPQLAKEELEKLADTPVGTEAAKNPSAPENIIEKAAFSTDENKRAAAAENPSAPQDILRRLSMDPSKKVRSAAAKNPAIPKNVMERLAKDEPEVRESLLENNMLPPDILDTITSGASGSCDFNRKLMANPCMDPATLAYNADNTDACIRAGTAANPNTPPEVIAKLAGDPSPQVRQAAWKNPKMPPDKISSLFGPGWVPDDKDIKLEEARKSALENPAASQDAMRKAVFISPNRYAANVAKNPSAPASLINRVKNLSEGSGGLKKFISDAMDMKTDPKIREAIKKEAQNYGGDPKIPLRKALNAGFINNVYDPYHLIEDMRRFTNPTGMEGAKAAQQTGDIFKSIDMSPEGPFNKRYSMDNFGDMPERFSDLPLPAGNGKNAASPEAEKAAFAAADAIVDGLMENVLPSFTDGAKAGAADGNPAASGPAGNAGANSGGGYGNGSGIQGGNYGHNTPDETEISPEWLFQNACERLDGLQSMF